KSAPLFEFANAVRGLLRMKLGHTPVVEKFSTAHGVAEVSAPIVGFVDVGHGSSDTTFGHNRMRFAEQRFADKADTRALCDGFNRGAKPRATCADDQNIMFVGFVGCGHRIRMSLITPEASIRI